MTIKLATYEQFHDTFMSEFSNPEYTPSDSLVLKLYGDYLRLNKALLDIEM